MHPNHRLRMARACAACTLAAGVAAMSWSATIPPDTVLAAKQEMVRNNGAEPDSLDPALMGSDAAGRVLQDVFESLTATDAHGAVVPGAAESWKQIDPVTWVFKLRKGAMWSNGEPLVAEDFVYGWRRLFDPKNGAPTASTFAPDILHAAAILDGKMAVADLAVRALDSTTLEVRTPGPISFMPEVVGAVQLGPAPRSVVEKFGKDWTKPDHMVGNGAFMLKEWQVNSRIVLEKNPRYWDAANVTLMRVTHLPVEDPSADLKRYQSGENDMTLQLPAGSFETLKAQFPREIRNGPMMALRYYALNNTDALLQDVRVRKALSMVIDRDVLATKVTADGQPPLYGLTLRGTTGVDAVRYDWADWPMARRVAEARALLAEAGVKPGTSIRLAYNTSEYHKKMAIFVASEWKTKLGLDVDMENMEFKVLLHRRAMGDFQVARDGWSPGLSDVTGLLALLQCRAGTNDDKSCDSKADELIAQATMAVDTGRRKALMSQAMRLEMEDYPMIPLLQYSTPRLVKIYIGGYDESNGQDTYRSKDFFVMAH